MSLPRTIAEIINDHVILELESLDRVFLNVYQPAAANSSGCVPVPPRALWAGGGIIPPDEGDLRAIPPTHRQIRA